jgi:hypothetical protein
MAPSSPATPRSKPSRGKAPSDSVGDAQGAPQADTANQGQAPGLTRVAIVGFTDSNRDVPWDDPTIEKWGMNDLHAAPHLADVIGSCSAWFDLHPLHLIEDKGEHHLRWLASTRIPVYTWPEVVDARPDLSCLVPFPVEDVYARFPVRYFTNSVSWMIAAAMIRLEPALAAYRNGDTSEPPEIAVYGVDMAQGTEYAAQRPSCEFYLGLAMGLGFRITIPATSDLLKSAGNYGRDDAITEPLRVKLVARERELRQKYEQAEAEYQATQQRAAVLRDHLNAYKGALDSNDYVLNVWFQPQIRRESPDA